MIYIAVISKGQTRVEWGMELKNQKFPLATQTSWNYFNANSLREAFHRRNLAVEGAIQTGCDMLMFWDDDIIFHKPMSVAKMIMAMRATPEISSLCAVYPMKNELAEPVCMEAPDQGASRIWEDGNVHQVWLVGTGATIYRVAHLQEVKPKLESYEVSNLDIANFFVPDEETENTDDFRFARIAEKHGMKQFIHGGIHADQMMLDGTRFKTKDWEVK